ncbi:DHH family phosphoesterase [Baia soyae]|uniref:Phosphoesterase RecJ-like protein n=1 Tax=Baia soyae TaxID=1544746 RepID=A0A4R2SBM4_9BACL|nr:bifunctional oligoribonuclease/PAP phosphatase NrnA [Baia soyae]TCP70096.1 phosphoesterase RecJ-like protein [Baia soyae]
MMNSFSDATRFIQSTDHVLITGHLHPDGDAIGSTLAAAWICKSLGKTVTLANDSHVPDRYLFLPDADQIEPAEEIGRRFQYVLALDCADEARIGKVRHLFSEGVQICNIDHHATNDLYGAVNIVMPNASSTVEILMDWMEELALPLDRTMATFLYTGLLTDTGGFRYSNTSPKVLMQAAKLVSMGIEGHHLADRLLETVSFRELQLLQVALSTLTLSFNGKVAWMVLTQDDFKELHATSDDIGEIVNYARNIEGVDVGILFREESDHFKVSLRSRGLVDVAEVAKCFGGGGHARAAGCSMDEKSMEAVEQQVLHAIYERLGGLPV